MRVLVIAHGHPIISAGGAERAAYSLFEHLKTRPEISKAFFAARAPYEMIGHDADFGLFRGRADEVLVSLPPVDHFTHQSLDFDKLKRNVTALLKRLRPDVVHVHHFAFFGLELLKVIKDFGTPVVFTIHEYLTICHHFGQMVKPSGALCTTASPVECSQCFSGYTPGSFFLREQMIKTLLSYADVFVSPSHFLAERYAQWGLSSDLLQVIENPLPPDLLKAARTEASRQNEHEPVHVSPAPIRLGFFGQMNPFKGLHVLLEALQLLEAEQRRGLMLGIHGANLEIQQPEFQQRMQTLLASLQGTAFTFGPYDNRAVVGLMKQYDYIVVPSVWWENSPVVIQEAQLAGTPTIVSRIGGMAEKVGGVGHGLHFEPGSAGDIAAVLARLVETGERPRVDPLGIVDRHERAVDDFIRIYKNILADSEPAEAEQALA